jgi:DNA-binding XRE family transcriptional regulator
LFWGTFSSYLCLIVYKIAGLTKIRVIMRKTVEVVTSQAKEALVQIGKQIKSKRTALSQSQDTLAKLAGMSRATLVRCESGIPGVAIGAYVSLAWVLGLSLKILDEAESEAKIEAISISDYPQLKKLSWQLNPNAVLTPVEAWGIYQRNYLQFSSADFTAHEAALYRALSVEMRGRGEL